MAVAGKKHPFKSKSIDKSPRKSGVYALYDGGKVIYYGATSKSIRTRLQRHLHGEEGSCTQTATHYKFERTSRPKKKERKLLRAYEAKHENLPHCNERQG